MLQGVVATMKASRRTVLKWLGVMPLLSFIDATATTRFDALYRPLKLPGIFERIIAFLDQVDQSNLSLHSFLIAIADDVLAEGYWNPYSAESRHPVFSIARSFFCMAVGLAWDNKLIDLDRSVVSYFPEIKWDAP